jgi:hypothetical protein
MNSMGGAGTESPVGYLHQLVSLVAARQPLLARRASTSEGLGQ